ncbi:MAG TPA: hypothetical protein VNJ46_07075 [Gaiellaceae bacterium]|nr:hypothetical protein [Gaiellaceae bacterium]
MPSAAALVLTVTALVGAGCARGDGEAFPWGSEHVTLDPRELGPQIDNPYWPMRPGARWTYREVDADGSVRRVVVTVTGRTRTILGVEARVVHDVVSEAGELVEDTYDWYAQDEEGNIWYLGEDTKEFQGGRVVSTAGSWEAGKDGAEAGILLPGEPEVGLAYRQEYYAGEAEDAAAVLSLEERVQVPAGFYRDVLMTKEFTPLAPGALEYKFYARGVGPVLALTVSGGSDREELVEHVAP